MNFADATLAATILEKIIVNAGCRHAFASVEQHYASSECYHVRLYFGRDYSGIGQYVQITDDDAKNVLLIADQSS